MLNQQNNDKAPNDLILLNRMYAGEFLNENIGFESINLIMADDGKNYIYVTPYGTMDIDKYKKVRAILFVRKYTPGSYQIIAKAENLHLAEEIEFYIKNNKHNNDIRQLQQTKIEKIKFAGISYRDIFKNNRTKTKSQNKINGAFYTYTGIVSMAKELLIISQDNFAHDSKNLFRSSLKMFIDEKTTPNAYKTLKKYIEDNIWDKTAVSSMCVKEKLHVSSNLISILGKEDDELSFSNLFAYIFRTYKEAFVGFLFDKLLTAKNFNGDQLYNNFSFSHEFEVEREVNNIDLKLTDIDGNIIVIENKIKSNINGLKQNHKSQLSKYYNIITDELIDQKVKASFFIFYPEYHKTLKDNLSSYLYSDKYALISYKDIYIYYNDWFKKNQNIFTKTSYEYFYFSEFLNSLKKHTKSIDNQQEEELKRKFNNRIWELKQNFS